MAVKQHPCACAARCESDDTDFELKMIFLLLISILRNISKTFKTQSNVWILFSVHTLN